MLGQETTESASVISLCYLYCCDFFFPLSDAVVFTCTSVVSLRSPVAGGQTFDDGIGQILREPCFDCIFVLKHGYPVTLQTLPVFFRTTCLGCRFARSVFESHPPSRPKPFHKPTSSEQY